MPEKQKKWALITGASPGGIGEAEVAAFLKRGVNVIATSIDIEENAHDIDDLKKQLNDNRDRLEGFLVSLRLDVTSTESIEAALEKVKELTGGRLDYLVNNAGFGYYYPLLDVSIPLAKKQFDVNVWGLLQTTQAFFPLLRAAKGTVINQASVAGIQNYNRPFMGIYSASKAAVMTLSSVMRVEFSPFEVRVVTLVTASVQTEFFNNRQGGGLGEGSVYFPVKAEVDAMMGRSKVPGKGYDRFEVADSTVEEVMREVPPRFVRRGYGGWVEWLYWLMPVWWLNERAVARSPLARLRELLSEEVASKKNI